MTMDTKSQIVADPRLSKFADLLTPNDKLRLSRIALDCQALALVYDMPSEGRENARTVLGADAAAQRVINESSYLSSLFQQISPDDIEVFLNSKAVSPMMVDHARSFAPSTVELHNRMREGLQDLGNTTPTPFAMSSGCGAALVTAGAGFVVGIGGLAAGNAPAAFVGGLVAGVGLGVATQVC
jgi:hypothetical protein